MRLQNKVKILLGISPVILLIYLFIVYHFGMHSGSGGLLPAPANRHNMLLLNQSTAQDPPFHLPPIKPGLAEVSPEERESLLAGLEWPQPSKTISSLAEATDGTRCFYEVVNLQKNYTVGGLLNVVLVARDGNGIPKTYGGDFLQAKLYNSELKASTFGPVVDHRNGTYTVRFSLLWPGPAKISIRLIHSSETVDTLSRYRQQDPDKVRFSGYFVDGAKTEEVACNAVRSPLLVGDGKKCCCQYQDPVTGESWFCQRPPTLPCWTLNYHRTGEYKANLSKLDRALVDQKMNDIVVPGRDVVIHVLPPDKEIGDTRPECKPGLDTPVPAGFFFQDLWTSTLCRSRSFSSPALVSACLKDKQIHMMGDSTLRQWLQFLANTVPTMKLMGQLPYIPPRPLLAVDPQSNTVLHWQTHGLPFRSGPSPIAGRHYIARDIEGIEGGEHTVVAIMVGAHFASLPLDIYIHRLATIRGVVRSLLQRAPRTLVVIKSPNTGYKDLFTSDWLIWQLHQILRTMFRDLPVVFINVWQMTSCHYSPDNIHPVPVVVMNEVDLFLSFICPQ